MAKILYNGKQYTLTISPDLIKRMGWEKGTEVIIGKELNSDVLYIEELKLQNKKARGKSRKGANTK